MKYIVHYRYTRLCHHSERKFFTLAGALRSARDAEDFSIISLSDNVTMIQTKGFVW